MTNLEATLPAREALEIAHAYGFTLRRDRKTIRENLIQARHYGAQPGGKSAHRYFDDYLAEEARFIDCDSKAARDFEDAAYGAPNGPLFTNGE